MLYDLFRDEVNVLYSRGLDELSNNNDNWYNQ